MKHWIKLLTLFLMVFVTGTASAQNVAAIGTDEYATLQAAFDAATDGQTVTLLGNYNAANEAMAGGTRQFVIKKSITFDGGGYTLTTKQRGIGIGSVTSTLSSNIDVTIKNITINNTSVGARCIDTRGKVGSLTLQGVTLKTDGAASGGYTQPLTIGGNQADAATISITNSTIQTNNDGTAYYAIITFNPVNMTITNSTIKGWACVYAKGDNDSAGSAGSVININGSTLVSSNAYSGVSNDFSALMMEDNNVTINVTNSNITINNTGDQVQSLVGYDKTNLTGTVTLGEGNTITFAGPNDCSLLVNGSPSNLSVTGGTFNVEVPEEYLADGHVYARNANGTYTIIEGEWVAQIGETKYVSLADAMAAVPTDGTATTITMIADATVVDGITVAAGKNISLDLNGKVLSLSKHIGNNGTLTIQDGTGTGRIESDAGYTIVNTGGTLTITSGTYTNNATDLILQRGGSITINGGSFTSSKSTVLNMQAYGDGNASLTITDGTFTAEKNDAIFIAAATPTISISGGTFITHSYVPNGNPAAATACHVVSNCTGGTITISGGTFRALSTVNGSRALNVGNNPGISVTGGDFYSSAADGRSVSSGTNGILAGGTFDGKINSNYVANGKFAYPNNDFTRYTIEDYDETRVNELAVAKIGDTYYTSLAEVSSEITEGCTVTLLKDLDFSEEFIFYLLKDMTFDGNGHTLTGNIMIDCNNGSGVARTGITIKDTKFVNTTATKGYVIRASKLSGEFTVTGCTFDNTKGQAIQCTTVAGADVTITGNTFKNGTGSKRYINLYGTGTNDASSIEITITGNIFYENSNTENLRLNAFGANNEFNINGNYFEDPTHSLIESFNNAKDSFEFTVYGLDANGEIDTTSEQTYIVTEASNKAIISLATMVAQIVGGAKYTSLQAALDAAHEMTGNVTVELLDDITGYSIVHQKAGLDLTIDGAAKTLAGQIIIDGDGRSEGTDKLTIQNIKFEDNKSHFYTGTDAFVLVPSTKTTGTPFYNNKNNYAHNVTVTNCSFTSTTSSFDVVGIKVTSGAAIYNVVISDNTASKLHSLAQLNGATGGTITNNTVSGGESFVNVTGGAGEMRVSGNTFTSADGADGYGIRENGSSTTVITLTDNTFTATSAVVLGKGDSQTAGTTNVESGIYTGTISKTDAATGKIVVSGGYFSEEVAQDYIIEGKVCVPATDMEGYFTIGDPHYVAQIGETKYVSLQAAVDAAYAMTGNVTIELIDNIEGYSIVKQKAGLNLTIDGKEKTVAGQIIIDGDGGYNRTETLDIKNINFEDNRTHFVSGSDAFIFVPSTNTAGTPYYNKPTNNYSHNVTISDCSFKNTASDLNTVAIKTSSGGGNCYNLVVNNVTGTNLHSLAQLTGSEGTNVISSNTISNSESFVNVSGGTGTFTISGNTFSSAEGADGYGVRENSSSSAVITLTDNNFTAANAVKLGKGGSKTNGTINVVSGTYVGDIVKDIAATATGKIVISGGKFSAPLADQQYAEFIAEGMAGVNGLYPEEELAKNGVGTAVASVTDSEGKVLNYASLEAAMAAAADGSTVTLLADCAGNGIVVPQGTYTTGLTVDFGGFTYTVVGPGLAGSTGTQNQCFQLLKDNNITFQNGAIVADNSNLKMIIQNYANLTLDNMTLDATQGTNSIEYVLSTNNGSTTINDTNITAKDGSVAFDACCGWGGYNSNNVELTGSSVVTGPIEVSFYGEGTAPTLTLTSGTHNGEIVMGKNADQATITKTDTFVQNAPEGYKWVSNGEGTGTSTLTPKVYVAQIGEGDSAVKYESLAEAVEAASDGDTITMIADDPSLSNGSEVEINKSLTITGPTAENGEPLYTISGNSDVTGSNDIFITGSGNVTISNLKIKDFGNNAGTDPSHAPLYVSTNFTGNLNLTNVYISDFNRGGLFLYGGTFEVDNCYIDCANATSGAFTKGIEIKGNATGTIKNTLICNMERSSTASNAGIEIYGNGSVTVEECTILSDKDGHAAVKGTYGIVSSRVGEHNPSGGSLVVKGCQIDTSNGSISISDDDTYGPVNNYSITVDDCDFTNYISTWSATSSITINSGSFSEDVYADAGTIIIKDGVFTNFAPYAEENATIAISGGIFDNEVPEEYCAEGFIPTANTDPDTMEDYPYTVKSGQFVAQIGDVKYETLAEAVAAVPENGTEATTITLLTNITENASVNNGKNIILDLDEKTLTGSINMNGGSLTAQNGTIAGTVNVYGSADASATNYNNFTLAADATINAGYGIILREASGTNVAYGATININGAVNGNLWVMGNIKEGNSVINVNSGAKIEGEVFGINGLATVNVKSGSTIIGSETGIEVRAGVLNVEGGTITSTANAYTYTPNGSGTTTTGAAIAVAQHNTVLPIEVNILGGTLSGIHNIAVEDAQDNNLDKVTVTVKDNLIIASTLIPDGFTWASNNDGTSTLKPAVAKIGDTYYATIEDAFAAITEGCEVILLDDVEMTKDYTAAKSFSLTTDGHTFDSQGHHIILNNGVTVTTDDQQPGLYEPIDSSKYAVKEEVNGDVYTYTCMTIEDYTGEYVLLDLWDGKVHNYPYTEAKQAKSITYKRRIPAIAAGNYQCWYVPFDYTIKDEDLENMDFFKIHMIAPASTAGEVSDNSEIWLYIEQLNAGKTMKGNRPYVVRTKGTGSDQSFVFTAENVPLLAPDASVRLDMATSHFNYDFYGTYKQAKPNKTPSISLWSTGLMNWVSNNQVLPYRWYFHVINKLGQDDYANLTFFIVEEGNEATGIYDLNFTQDNEIEGIYTIDGKKLDHPIKGLNIIKMKDNTVKKVYIK